MENKKMGKHILLDISYTAGNEMEFLLTNPITFVDILYRAAEIAGATVLRKTYHIFDNGAFTAILLLSESHISVHTWPENGSAALDIYTCGDVMPEIASAYIKEYIKPDKINESVILRGINV